MSESIRGKLNGNRKEAIEHARLYGRFATMGKYDIRDYVSFTKFIEEETNDPNFGLHPVFNTAPNQSWAESLLDAFLAKLSKMEAENHKLASEISRLERDVDYYKANVASRLEPRISQIMTLCRDGD